MLAGWPSGVAWRAGWRLRFLLSRASSRLRSRAATISFSLPYELVLGPEGAEGGVQAESKKGQDPIKRIFIGSWPFF